MVSIIIYSLIGCYFSQKAELTMVDFNLKNKIKIIKVKYEEKDKYKKLNNMNTFPQIFLLKDKKKYKIGGADQLDNIIRIIKEINTYESNINTICLFNDLINKFLNLHFYQYYIVFYYVIYRVLLTIYYLTYVTYNKIRNLFNIHN